jgi:hypothetical protein
MEFHKAIAKAEQNWKDMSLAERFANVRFKDRESMSDLYEIVDDAESLLIRRDMKDPRGRFKVLGDWFMSVQDLLGFITVIKAYTQALEDEWIEAETSRLENEE